MFRRRAQQRATGGLIETGLPMTPELDTRLGEAIARGRELAEAG
jgi:hypothetical protein